jgi:hypothetical protein
MEFINNHWTCLDLSVVTIDTGTAEIYFGDFVLQLLEYLLFLFCFQTNFKAVLFYLEVNGQECH